MAMSEEELRIAGAEKAILALAPFVSDEGLREGRALLQADMEVCADREERIACLHALDLLADGARRFRWFDLRAWLRGPMAGVWPPQ
jgi:hypothetical protein